MSGVGFSRRFPRVWLLPIIALTVLLGIAAFGHLSRSIVADLIAWWPAWVGLAVAAYVVRDRTLGVVRLAGIVPLVALFLVVMFTLGHLGGWTIMPSASHRLVGPEPAGIIEAELVATVDGVIEVAGGSEFLYQVEPVMRGGGIGIPGANETAVDSTISVVLDAPGDPGLYSYAGWELTLSDQPSWWLTLEGVVDADLNELDVDDLSLTGDGQVRLGTADQERSVSVDGSFRLIVPTGTAAQVVGAASVPANWSLTDQGAVSPSGGDGWVIRVAPGSEVSVVEG